MKQEIKYRGFTAQPSDYECPDGDLAASFNLVHEDGSMRPLPQPSQLFQLDTGKKILFIHTTAVFKHYIVLNTATNTLAWIDANDSSFTPHDITDQQPSPQPIQLNYILKANAVGNTLCVLCGSASAARNSNDGIHYLLWQSENSNYKYLGTKPEFIELSFGLSDNKFTDYESDGYDGTFTTNYAFVNTGHAREHYLGPITETKSAYSFREDTVDDLNNFIWALVNKATAKVSKEGHFYAPFFVRYCYRMYDGTMWMHSAPVFMPVSMPYSYVVDILNYNMDNNTNQIHENGRIGKDDGRYTYLRLACIPQNVALTCKIINGSVNDFREKWGDIVKSIDIFVSLPIIREDTSEKILSASLGGRGATYNLLGSNITRQNYKTTHLYNTTPQTTYDPFAENGHTNNFLCNIPLLSEEAYLNKIHNVANFYKVKSFSLEEAATALSSSSRSEIAIEETVLPGLAAREVMTDDYKSHNTILPLFDNNGRCVTSLYNYNGRQNIAALREQLFKGFVAMTPYSSIINIFNHSGISSNNNFEVQQIDVFIRTEDGMRVSSIDMRGYTIIKPILFNCPLFYPDNRAVRMEIYTRETESGTTTNKKYVVPMKSHPMLNGAITEGGIMSNLSDFYDQAIYTLPVLHTPRSVPLPSKIYTSEVDNPFFFSASGINTVGTGTILGISSATKALSQGQFGQFPLYAFTSDGVWALSVSSTGVFADKHPVTRDVCSEPDSITQLDNSVLFASNRGIMQLSGSSSECISDFLNDEKPVDSIYDLLQLNQSQLNQIPQLSDFNFQIFPFNSFLNGCRLLYDYTHQHVILFNPSDYHYAYVYSIKSKLWGLTLSNLSYTLNSYPDALAVDHDNYIVSFSQIPLPANFTPQLLITRPLKLGDAGTLKSVHNLIQRGFFRGRHSLNGNDEDIEVKTILYGSRDLFSWHILASSTNNELRSLRGSPYKYFRIVAIANLQEGHSLSGTTIDFEPRYTRTIH